MAERLAIQGLPGMTHFWNVSQRVGGRQDCPNRPTDVELVKVLMKKALEDPTIAGVVARTPSPQIVVNQQWDATIGYWIFRFQDHDGHPVIDGVASHAKRLVYQPGSAWVIGLINIRANKVD